MPVNKLIFSSTLICLFLSSGSARQKKEADLDVIYDEALVPAIMKHSFDNTRSRKFDVHPNHPGRLRNGWPVGNFFDRGFGFVAVYQLG